MTHARNGREPAPLLIFPFNGNAVEALDCLADRYTLVGFVDDTPEKQGGRPFGYEVFGREAFDAFPQARVLAVPGNPASFRARGEIIGGLALNEARFAQVVHPAARISPLASIGSNVLVMAGVVLTSTCIVKDHVCILPNTVIHHDVTIDRWSLVGSNVTIAGGASIGENCYIGSGSSVMNGLRIGSGALLGLGSNVIRDVEPGTTVAGNPARALIRR